MFLVLIEYIDNGAKEWSVCSHGPKGTRSTFTTHAMAENYAIDQAKERTNRFAVVEIKCCFQQKIRKVEIKKVSV